MCRKRGAVSLGSALRRQMGWEVFAAADALQGGGDAWSSALGSPPPFWAAGKSLHL